jgi:hypothetical protein
MTRVPLAVVLLAVSSLGVVFCLFVAPRLVFVLCLIRWSVELGSMWSRTDDHTRRTDV